MIIGNQSRQLTSPIIVTFASVMKLHAYIISVVLTILSFSGFSQSSEKWNQKDANGLKSGNWRGLHKNGKLRYIGQFSKDEPYGVFKYYFNTGELQTVLKYVNPKEAYATHFYITGEPMASGKFIDKQKDSIWVFFDMKGKRMEDGQYLNGRKFGVWRTYYNSGEVSSEVPLEADLEQGSYKAYYPDGSLKQESIYKDGFLNGLTTHYSSNGKKTVKGLYVRGQRDGHWVFYDDKQQVKRVQKYDMGKLLNPEVLEGLQEDDLELYRNNRKDVLEFDDLRGRIKYE